MAKAKGDRYIIDRDERDIPGGKLKTVAYYDDWKMAREAWDAWPLPDRADVTFWFARVSLFANGKKNVITLDCKDMLPQVKKPPAPSLKRRRA